MENVLASQPPLTTINPTAPNARGLVWIGRVLTGLTATFLMLDAVGKLIPLALVVEGTQKLGYAVSVIRPLGVVLALSTLLHLFPRTQLLGAVLVTAYLGGATDANVRAGMPFWFPVAMGAILWVAYWLRSPRLRAFILSTTR
jgi:DoxX-like family